MFRPTLAILALTVFGCLKSTAGPVTLAEHPELKGRTLDPKNYMNFEGEHRSWNDTITSVRIDNDDTIVLLAEHYKLTGVNLVLYGKGTYDLRDYGWDDRTSSVFWVEKPSNPLKVIQFLKDMPKPGEAELPKLFELKGTKPARDLAQHVRDNVAQGNEREASWESLMFDRDSGKLKGDIRVRHRQVSGKVPVTNKPIVTYDLGTNGRFEVNPLDAGSLRIEVGVDKPPALGGGQIKFGIGGLGKLNGQ